MEERLAEIERTLRKLADELDAMLPQIKDTKREDELLEARKNIIQAANWLE